MKNFIKKTWIYWLAIILTELVVFVIVIGLDYGITNNIEELYQTAQIGNYTFTYELIAIAMLFITIIQIINFLIYSLWNYLFGKILKEYRNYKNEKKGL